MPREAAKAAAASAAARLAERCVPGSGPVEVETLVAGLVNQTYRIRRDGVDYGLRIAAPGARSLGLDPPWELRVLEVAGPTGIAPAMVHHDLASGVLVTRWSAGRTWDAAQTRTGANLSRMAGLIRRVHALCVPLPHRAMSPEDWIRLYEGTLSDASPCERVRCLQATARAWRREFARLPCVPAVLCHSDLHVLNVLDTGAQLQLLDWEFAHVGEALWDTAAWISNNDLETLEAGALLAAYLGRAPHAAELERQRLLCWGFDYVCLLWSEVYLAIRGAAAAVEARAGLLAERLATRPWS